MQYISRSDAIQQGLNQYYEGRPCVRGHRARRWVHSYGCTECHHLHNANRRNSTKGKAYQANYYRRVKKDFPERVMYQTAKRRAREAGLPFDITPDDIRGVFPENGLCPALGIPLDYAAGKRSSSSASLDRLHPKLGYVRGNIAVISMQANLMKSNVTDPDKFRRMARWLEKVVCVKG